MKQFFDELKKDHEEVKGILGKLNDSSDGAVKTREKLFAKLKEELIPHLKAEESAFYPILKDKKGARKKALESMEEHSITELACEQLGDVPVQDEVWSAKLKVLKDLVEHHIQEEEQEIFKVAKDSLNNDEFKEIMQNFNEQKEEFKKSI